MPGPQHRLGNVLYGLINLDIWVQNSERYIRAVILMLKNSRPHTSCLDPLISTMVVSATWVHVPLIRVLIPRWGNRVGDPQDQPSSRPQHGAPPQSGRPLPAVWTPTETGQNQEQAQDQQCETCCLRFSLLSYLGFDPFLFYFFNKAYYW